MIIHDTQQCSLVFSEFYCVSKSSEKTLNFVIICETPFREFREKELKLSHTGNVWLGSPHVPE
jgi:hypothetical protein